jgi:predicted nucleic acid-binding protein
LTTFVDTSALYALMDGDDAHHAAAARRWSSLVGEERALATSNYVLVESFALVQRRLGLEALRVFEAELLPVISVLWVDSACHASAVQALLTARRRSLSLVDCTSFDLMRRSGITSAFAYDRHFRDQGFTVVA